MFDGLTPAKKNLMLEDLTHSTTLRLKGLTSIKKFKI